MSTAVPVAAWPIAEEQKGLWYLQQAHPQLGAYNLLFSCTVEKTGEAWPSTEFVQRMINDYPLLRTAFVSQPGGAVEQQVVAHLRPRVVHHDARDLTDDSLRERARQDSRAPLDLNEPGAWRIHLYRRTPDCYLLVVVMHHIAFDFWSMGLLLKDAMTRWQGQPSTLPAEQANGYEQHARQPLDPQRHQQLTRYWTASLLDAPALHSLPLDHPRPGTQAFQGASWSFRLDPATSAGIQALGRSLHATPYMVMLAIYTGFLGYWSSSSDVVVSTPVANRTARRLRNTLGQFVNTLCLRTHPAPDVTFATLVGDIKTTVTEAIRHQDLPFYRLVEALAPKRDSSYQAIAQLGFSWEHLPVLEDFAAFYGQEASSVGPTAGNVRLSPFPVPQQEGQLDLLLEMGGQTQGGYDATLKYNPHLFDLATVRQMAEHLAAMAARMVANPALPLAELAQANAHQQARWQALGRGQPLILGDRTLLHFIGQHARARANSPAVADAHHTYGYQQLWQRSQQWAQALHSRGVVKGARVGFKLERCADLVPLIIGIWRLGACYVPLDPHFPAERLAYIAQDAQLTLVVTEPELDDFPSAIPRLLTQEVGETGPIALPEPAQADDTAYILYTSGSTGQPKGVEVSHLALLNFMLALHDELAFDSQTRLLAVTTPSFDISLLELFLPLVAGGLVQVADFASTRDGARLAGLIEQHAINTLQATPATWQMLLEQTAPGALETLTALCGGDALPQALADRLLARTAAVWNLYGPTETTIWSSLARLQCGVPVSLGKPIANTEFIVLDEQQRLVPPGMLGELWIGGAGLAKGYLHRPELTRERFCVLPRLGTQRWYRTGDQVRWNSRGELEHHGRLDFQVKLRGYRIELEEVQARLLALHGVQQAVAAVVDHELGSALVAYLVTEAGAEPAIGWLKSQLKAQLPAYMVPTEFVFLARLPLTPNNKVDRQRLPAPGPRATRVDITAPRDDLEGQLLEIFQRTLRAEALCIHDDFFDMGGHSLLAVDIISQANRTLGTSLSVADLLGTPTVAGLGDRVRSGTANASGTLITLRPGHGRPVWLFHPIGGNVLSYRELGRHLSGNRPVIAVQSPGLENPEAVEVTVEAMATRYVEDIRQVQPEGPYLVGGWCFGGAIAYEVASQLQAMGQGLEGVFLIDTRAPIAQNVPSDADDSTLLSWFARDLATPHGVQWDLDPSLLRSRASEDAFAYVLTQAKQRGLLGEHADDEQLARYFETYLANGIALQLYAPPATTLPLLLVLARDEPADYGPLLGWQHLALGPLTAVPVAGDHNTVMYRPQVAAVAELINHHFIRTVELEPQP